MAGIKHLWPASGIFGMKMPISLMQKDLRKGLAYSTAVPTQLTTEEKKIESRKMELYAAMVDNLDKHIGEVIQFLKDSKQLENTLVVFMSDNGAAAEDFYTHPRFGPFIRSHYDNSYENIGKV